ncbi:LamB/YcsF family protein [Arthrobacter sulfonylureivorans]|uniref:LamB/YcsF family protein n=1 Tax=Arthrobacter sulfonylureivorans TaxID=2486855 RepID=A0ABY3WDV9_9MICC|nr:5-oxoprolinase subunit PxpA [Arthrobacter sulfonylureivorans]UNK45874.1 LamB/YcsF family protein [Arthrobacter sulfonylureivorans]
MTASDRPRIDLNSDLGESVDGRLMGDDAAMFPLITSANIACGYHAGDDETMLASCRRAAENQVAVGAHVSYQDREGFGRRSMEVAPADLVADVASQLAALDRIARGAGTPIAYVKPHGALYNRIVHDRIQAAAVVEAVGAFDPQLPILGLPGSAVLELAAGAGLPVFREAFVDRGYRSDGTLIPRGEPGDLLEDLEKIADRAVEFSLRGAADSLCVHGDTPGAVAMARLVRQRLAAAGISLRPFTDAARTSGR